MLNHGGLDNRLKYYVGCSGWKNQTWAKDFYPATLEPENYLEYYSNIYESRKYTQEHFHTHAHTHKHAQHLRIHIYKHTHTHTHTHTCIKLKHLE